MKPKKPAIPAMPRFLAVPYDKKDNAKALGMKWHPYARLWYIPKGVQRAGFPYQDAPMTREAWQAALALEQAERDATAKARKHYIIKTNAEAHRPTRQILSEGDARLSFLLEQES